MRLGVTGGGVIPLSPLVVRSLKKQNLPARSGAGGRRARALGARRYRSSSSRDRFSIVPGMVPVNARVVRGGPSGREGRMRRTVCEQADDVERRKAAWEGQICTE